MDARTSIRTSRLAIASLLVCAVLAGCTEFDLIRIDDVPPVKPDRDFSSMNCDQLKDEANRIDAEFKPYVGTFKHGTRNGIARLKGETIAVNARLQELGCKVAQVVMPTNRPLPPTSESAAAIKRS